MITKQQAMNPAITEIHYGQCSQTIGPRGQVVYQIQKVRRNGKCVTYKSRPDDWRLPCKYGLKQGVQITPDNADEFHDAADCLLAQPHMVKQRENASVRKHLGTIILALSKPLDRKSRKKLLNLSHNDKMTIASHAFPAAAAQILINKQEQEKESRNAD